MTFASVEYLIFLPIVFLLYWILCNKSKNLQNILIVVSSLVFYGWWDWRFLGLLLITALSTFLGGLLIQKHNKKEDKIRKIISAGIISLNIVILFYFKYFNFFLQSFIDAYNLFGRELTTSTLKIILPVGVSFYTFTALSYSIDIYQKKITATKDIFAYLSYIMFFPSILSGPISRAQKQLPQYYEKRVFNYNNSVAACKMLLWGAIMKYCLADRLGIYVDAVYNNIHQHNGTTLLLASILYTIQIYSDFAGYSLIAIGSGKLMGINLPTNFIRPYFAKTVADFWRRWHISLTTWFRDYIYFPLGGNRVGKSRWMLNTMIVFVVSGLWHGAAYTFLIWGALHGVCMIIERQLYGNKIKEITDKLTLGNLLRMLITFCVVSFAWIFFRAESFSDAVTIISKICTSFGSPFLDENTMLMAVIALIIVFIYDICDEYKINLELLSSKHMLIRYITAILLICYVLAYGVLNSGSFIYFQF